MSVIFEETARTLQEIAANPEHLGAELGFLGVLHTWSRQLLGRFLEHALPAGTHRMRYFGWLHPSAKKRRLIVETLLAAPASDALALSLDERRLPKRIHRQKA